MPHRRTSSITSLSGALSSYSPNSFSSQPQPTMSTPSIKYITTKLQCISNYKLRIESSQSEPRLERLLGHISIYDSVREWRQSQARSSIETTMRATQKLTSASPLSQPCQTVSEFESQQIDYEQPLYICQHQTPAFADFQAAIELQLATMEQVKAAQRQLQRMTEDDEDGNEVEEYESDSEAGSDYDSYDGEDVEWREDGSDSDDSMTDPESVRSEPSSPVADVKAELGREYFGLEAVVATD